MKFDVRMILIVTGSLLAIAVMVAIGIDVNRYNQTVEVEEESDDAEVISAERQATDAYAGEKVYWPGVRQPKLVAADEVRLADDAEVVGVTANGKSRAYLLDAFRLIKNTHVEPGEVLEDVLQGLPPEVYAQLIVNDLVAGVPITVTYCEKDELIRVLTAAAHQGPLDVWLANMQETEIVVNFQDTNYSQSSSELPLQDYPFERTSWRSWLTSHPDSEIYTGAFQSATDELTGDMPTLDHAAAGVDVWFRSVRLQYKYHERLEIDKLYRLLEAYPDYSQAHELLAEDFANRGNDLMAESHRNLARKAATKQKDNAVNSPAKQDIN